MDTSESGDDLGNNFLAVETQNFMVHGEELDGPYCTNTISTTYADEDDGDAILTAENTDDSNQGGGDKPGYPLREQDRFLPIANIAKIMKRGIPEPGKIAKDARECVQECVSEFISFITSEASDRCHMEKRKTINGEDILFAMTTLGFDNYVEPLKLYLQKYREATKVDKPLVAEMYEEMPDETFGTQTLQGNIITSEQNGAGETVIYTYPEQIQQFQLP
ncbi:nuclear transcription factor Y subunit beta isoform X1 [Schistocerca piceifrons]|uniref:nuclear transcription factor Y subunit beta isoform X1 n=1 Tax=Schistocerca piceifrons TaxID=274613 RepID=UPI001F5EA36B|nr:nuclear transcription factor Y subunit beta isoform X1 [Schistocerca piceifrons]XP_049784658.1 nuclear transcription factor Y subunit beta isoform X1 [Schistocerca cancellata]XP_049813288.1 nuclear transcription factor Y subunit beta isoform X1 [Schistocerca nitens]XP_049827098.1 nuclear transcription factor Y subunit beta-like isoform X1 [Schistocerca gregaria]XP_049961200.1 nuclear transcription factor Y subunit beta isoform X1 [Schistocerca serialis cubense]